MRWAIGFVGAWLAAALSSPAAAQADLFASETLSGLVDARLTAADGETSFVRGGFGKSQASGGGAAFAARPEIDLATLQWRPRIGADWSGDFTLQNQPGQAHAVDVAQAYVVYKPVPTSSTRVSARFGLMWPPASLEHDGVAWTTTRSLTPSAINTWIAEEVKVVGAEGSISQEVAGGLITGTLAVFADNDTSGTLLAFRGWALDDRRTTAYGALPLPHFGTNNYHTGQADEAEPSLELDGRPGGYARLQWRPPAPLILEAFVYDNGGDPHVFKHGQWGWRTTFADVGLTARPAPDIEVLAQALTGRTYFGRETPAGWYVDVDFSSAYLLASKLDGPHRFTARVDWFETTDQSFKADDNDERGWALTGDYAYQLTPNLSLWFETLRLWSNRPARAFLSVQPTQSQTVLQFAVRARL